MEAPSILQKDVTLAPHTTFQIGGPAEYFAVVTDPAELSGLCRYAAEWNLPITIIGGGSNLLVADAGISGLVVQMALRGRQVTEVDESTVLVTYAAGESFDAVVADTVDAGWWGLENLSHIPGSVGATPVQNVGAYGVEVADVIDAVDVYDRETDTCTTLSPTMCQFTYRGSVFKQPAGHRYIITAVTFRLSTEPRPQLRYADLQSLATESAVTQHMIRERVITVRAGKFPDWTWVGTAGSFFKNPIVSAAQTEQLQSAYPEIPVHAMTDGTYKVALGWLLDRVCGLRGYQVGPVGTHAAQALVVVNHGGATAADVVRLADEITKTVYEKTGVTIEWEVTRLPHAGNV